MARLLSTAENATRRSDLDLQKSEIPVEEHDDDNE